MNVTLYVKTSIRNQLLMGSMCAISGFDLESTGIGRAMQENFKLEFHRSASRLEGPRLSRKTFGIFCFAYLGQADGTLKPQAALCTQSAASPSL